MSTESLYGGTATHYAYDGQSVAQEGHLESGSFVADVCYLTGPRGNECRIDENSGITKWYLYDGLGSVIGEVDENGNVTYTAKYDVYGATRGSTGSSASKNKFCGSLGHTSEPDAGGLIYMRARWYDPAAGRFISEDPRRDGRNWFTYCANNPINQIDPDGRMSLGDTGSAISMSEAVDSAGSQLATSILKGKALELVLYIDARMAAMGAAFDGAINSSRGGQLVLRWISSVTGKTTTFRLDVEGGHINIAGFARNAFGGHAVEFEKWLKTLDDIFGQ